MTGAPVPALAADPAPAAAPAPAGPRELDAAVELALAYLAKQQKPDGSFEGPSSRLAVTALAVMAYLAAGHAPGPGRYGPTVTRAVDYLVGQAPPNGYFGSVDGSRMYGHGIVTLALVEASGVETDPRRRRKIHDVLIKAIQIILDAQAVKKDQHHAGGWRYEPTSADSDLSLSGWNALALRAAKNVGIDVPSQAIEQAVAYVLKCYNADQKGFGYMKWSEASAGMTGVGVLNLYLLSGADRDEARAAAQFLREKPVKPEDRFPYYALYYTTQAAHQVGGETWDAVWANARQQLLAMQMPDGGWPQSRNNEEPGRTYATAMAVLTLSVPYRLLPIYQR